MAAAIKEPHLFNAGSNPLKVIRNLEAILAPVELDKIRQEIVSNVVGLYRLGESQCEFACALPATEWRQRISRFYYAAYNVRRAVVLRHDGSFSTDSSDHRNVHSLPDKLPNCIEYKNKFGALREDRNLADYNHLATESELVLPQSDSESLVRAFLSDVKTYLGAEGVAV